MLTLWCTGPTQIAPTTEVHSTNRRRPDNTSVMRCYRHILRNCALVICCAGCLAGCSNRPAAVSVPSINPRKVADFAMEHYDKDHNGAIDATEMAACPPLKAAFANYDTDKNGQLSAEEIEN